MACPVLTCRWELAPQPRVGQTLILQAEPHALTDPALQDDGSLHCLSKQAQQPLQRLLESYPGRGSTVDGDFQPGPQQGGSATGAEQTLMLMLIFKLCYYCLFSMFLWSWPPPDQHRARASCRTIPAVAVPSDAETLLISMAQPT